MSGRGGGRGGRGGSSAPRPKAAAGKLDGLKRTPGRSPARSSPRQDSPSRASPTVATRGRGRGRGGGSGSGSPRGSPATRGNAAATATGTKKQSAEKPQPPSAKVSVVAAERLDEIATRRRKKGPRISENPEAPQMEDMDGIRSTTVSVISRSRAAAAAATTGGISASDASNGDLKNGEATNGIHSPSVAIGADADESVADGSEKASNVDAANADTKAAAAAVDDSGGVKSMISEMVTNLSTELLDRIETKQVPGTTASISLPAIETANSADSVGGSDPPELAAETSEKSAAVMEKEGETKPLEDDRTVAQSSKEDDSEPSLQTLVSSALVVIDQTTSVVVAADNESSSTTATTGENDDDDLKKCDNPELLSGAGAENGGDNNGDSGSTEIRENGQNSTSAAPTSDSHGNNGEKCANVTTTENSNQVDVDADESTGGDKGMKEGQPAGPFEQYSAKPITLAELENGMVPVESVDIEHIQQDGTTTSINNLELEDVPLDQVPGLLPLHAVQTSPLIIHKQEANLPFDKSQLFSKMNDTFAKDTQEVLKSRQVKRPRLASKDAAKKQQQQKDDAKKPKNKDEDTSPPVLPLVAPSLPPPFTPPPLLQAALAPPILTASIVPESVETDSSAAKAEAAYDDDLKAPPPLQLAASTKTPLPIVSPVKVAAATTLSAFTAASELSAADAKEPEMEFPEPPVLEKQVDIKPMSELKSASTKAAKMPAADNASVDAKLEVIDKKPVTVGDLLAKVDDSGEPGIPAAADTVKVESSGEAAAEAKGRTPPAISASVTSDAKSKVAENESQRLQPTNTSGSEQSEQSELTKSLRRVRKEVRKTPSKRDKSPEPPATLPPPQQPQHQEPSTPLTPRTKSFLSRLGGTEVFDFTDEEDIPLSNIDLDALNEVQAAAAAAAAAAGNPLQISIPESTASISPRPSSSSSTAAAKSPVKQQQQRFEVSPTILSVEDALAAVMAVRPAGGGVYTPLVKLNGELLSDDTDTSLGRGGSAAGGSGGGAGTGGRVGKRRKRRMMESDGGDTEDDLDTKKDTRPKRSRPSAASTAADSSHVTRPSSAASVTSTASARDLETRLGGSGQTTAGGQHDEELDGKHSPDSQKSNDEKSGKVLLTVVPEKASSFGIHPERTCADCCYYCGLKFGMLDTPLHVAQLKTTEKQEFAMQFTGFGTDACLCDRCFRFLDRRAAARDMNGAKTSKEEANKEEKVKKCLIRTCNRGVTGSVSKKWLIRLKKRLMKKVSLDWDRVSKASVKATFLLCSKHNGMIEFYSNCGLCKRKLTISGICTLGMSKKDVEEMNILLREDHIPADLKENNFVCKLCKTFCGIKQKSLQPDYLKNHKTHKAFYKDYRRRLYVFLELGEEEEEAATPTAASPANNKPADKHPKKLFKVSQSAEGSCKITISAHTPATGDRKRRREKDFASPNADAKIRVNSGEENLLEAGQADPNDKCAVNIQFDLATKKLWQDLHYPYGNYTSFFRHLILLEKYWRSGDLSLASGASLKAASYLKSVRNRITAYEGKISDADLSAATRPDLQEVAAPTLTHTPGEAVLANLPTDLPSPKMQMDPVKESTILRIPRVPHSLLSPTNSILSPESLELTRANSAVSPKIRVRQDLMNHLGLVARPTGNISNIVEKKPKLQQQQQQLLHQLPSQTNQSINNFQPQQQQQLPKQQQQKQTQKQQQNKILQQQQRLVSSLSATTAIGATAAGGGTTVGGSYGSTTTPNLAKLLSDTNTTYTVEEKVVPSMKSSNSQLFKSTESSGAIPLTFNNSIAEVLAAAASKSKHKSGGRAPSPKPEITITAKSNKDPSAAAAAAAAAVLGGSVGGLKISKKTAGSGGGSYPVGSSSGGLSILKRTITSGSAATTPAAGVNPLLNMSKVLQSAAPGLPPHIVAAQTMPGRATSGVAGAQKILQPPRPTGTTQFRPVQLGSGKQSSASLAAAATANNSGLGIQTVNKKSLTTVLDRLSGLTTAGSPTQLSTSPLSSSLVQQLQAPTVSNRTSITAGTKVSKVNKAETLLRAQISKVTGGGNNSGGLTAPNIIPNSSGGATSATPASALPGSLIVPPVSFALSQQQQQPSVIQFPGAAATGGAAAALDPALMFPNMMGANMTHAQTAAAAQAANMMAAMVSMSGLTQQQTVELLQQQQQLLNQQQQRLRGPPPLKNMSRKPD